MQYESVMKIKMKAKAEMRTTRNTTPKDNITYLRYFGDILQNNVPIFQNSLYFCTSQTTSFQTKCLLSALGPGCLPYENVCSADRPISHRKREDFAFIKKMNNSKYERFRTK